MKRESVVNTVIEAMAEKIDRLNGEIFCKEYEISKLKDENKSLKKTVERLEKALIEEADDE